MARSTLEQWRMLKAVIEFGGFAQAAEAIHKSQSTINHAIHKLEDQLGVQLLQIKGRKAVLTNAGALLLRQSNSLLLQVEELEKMAGTLGEGLEAEISLAVDQSFPRNILQNVLAQFSAEYPDIRLQIYETVLTGAEELVEQGKVDLVITCANLANLIGEYLTSTRFTAVASGSHCLSEIETEITVEDLKQFQQIVVRDSSYHQEGNVGWLGAEKRLTVSHISTSIEMVKAGRGFAWIPVSHIEDELESGALKRLAVDIGSERVMNLLLYQTATGQGKASSYLAELFKVAFV